MLDGRNWESQTKAHTYLFGKLLCDRPEATCEIFHHLTA